MATRLSLYPTRRQPRFNCNDDSQFDGYNGAWWFMAWRQLDLRSLGVPPWWRAFGRSPAPPESVGDPCPCGYRLAERDGSGVCRMVYFPDHIALSGCHDAAGLEQHDVVPRSFRCGANAGDF